jgi:hypothetical protein
MDVLIVSSSKDKTCLDLADTASTVRAGKTAKRCRAAGHTASREVGLIEKVIELATELYTQVIRQEKDFVDACVKFVKWVSAQKTIGYVIRASWSPQLKTWL